jgi:hypothetical protein
MPYVGHLWASCWDPVPLSSHPGIIGTNEQKKRPPGSLGYLRLAQECITFPVTSVGATRMAASRRLVQTSERLLVGRELTLANGYT